jgi:hypothetical protein
VGRATDDEGGGERREGYPIERHDARVDALAMRVVQRFRVRART